MPRRSEITKLTPQEERAFQLWVSRNKISDVDTPESHYDYRGFWKANPESKINFGIDHFPDTFKQHGHPTFSVESQYSTGRDDGGTWQGEKFIPAKTKEPTSMPEKFYTVTSKTTGKKFTMPWEGTKPPTSLDVKQYLFEQENPKPKSTWEMLNEPLLHPSKLVAPLVEKAWDYGENNKGPLASLARGAGAFGQAFSGGVDQLTSPLSLGLFGLGAAARVPGQIGRAAAPVNTAANVGLVGQGAYNVYSGETPEEKAGGAIQAGLGAFGLMGGRGAAARPTMPDAEVVPPPRSGGLARRSPPPPEPRGVRGLLKGDTILDGEIIPDPQALPPVNDRGLPPPRRTFYNGPQGTSENVTDAGLPKRTFAGGSGSARERITNWSGAQARLREGDTSLREVVPESGAGQRDILEQNSPYGMKWANEPLGDVGGPKIPGFEMEDKVPNSKLKNSSDSDIEFLASEGDEAAIAEAKTRPSLWERIKGQRGSAGDLEGAALPAGTQQALRDLGFSEQRIRDTSFEEAQKAMSKPKAVFKGLQEDGQGGQIEMYDIIGGERHGSTVSGQTVEKLGIPVEKPRSFGVPKIGETSDRSFESAARKQGMAQPLPKEEAATEQPSGPKKFLTDLYMDEAGSLNTKPLKEAYEKLFGKSENDEPSMLRRMLNPASKLDPQTRTLYERWVNKIHASKVEGVLKGREFKDLDNLGMDPIHAIQAGSKAGRLADVTKYFDAKYAELKAAGVPVGYRENYLPQVWADAPEKVREVYRRLGLKPSITLDRFHENYMAGIDAGLKPKFKNVSELVQWYEQKANKAMADREFYDMMRKYGWIEPKGKGGPDWKEIDPTVFPHARVRARGSNEVRVLPMTAPPELQEVIQNYLRNPPEFSNFLADKASLTKNFAMSSGIPGTGINAHGFNILARTIMGNPSEALTTAKYIVNPRAAKGWLDAALPRAPEAVKAGLTMSTEGHEFGVSGSGNLVGDSVRKFLKLQGKMFEDPLFQNIIPALKLKHWESMVDDLTKGGMGREAAKKQAAQFTNNLYGGINWEAMGRSRELQNLFRLTALAPDWLETNGRIGHGIARNLTDPSHPLGRSYAKMTRNIIGAYVAADVMNYTLSGHHLWENSPGHAFDIQAGRSGDKDRWVRPFGTGVDFLRLPFDTAVSAASGDLGQGFRIIKNRLSIPASTIGNLLMNQNDFGRPIYGKDVYGRKIPVKKQATGILGEVSDLVAPPYVRGAIDLANGRVNPEQAALGSAEMPVRYSQKPNPRSARNRRVRD